MRRLQKLLPAVALVAIVTACQSSGAPPDDGGHPQSVAVQVDPPTANVGARGSVAFAAAVTGTANTSVVWSVVEQGGGTVDASGLYTAPATPGTFHVRATSAVEPLAMGESTVTVAAPPIAVSIAPTTPSVAAGGTITFTATVTNTTNRAVTWSVGGTSCGTITQAGVYTAPAAAGTCSVVATSQADTTRRATATVTVTAPPPAIAVSIAPTTPSVAAGGTITFTATVTNTTNRAVTWSVGGTSCGTITQAGVYTAPAAAGTCSVVATSQADTTRRATATVTVTAPPAPISVSVTPSPAATNSCSSLTFTAAVANTTNRAVTWSVQEGAAGGSITTAGVYTAPQNAGTYHVVATSAADATKTAIATVTVTDRILSVAVSPQTTTVAPSGTARFTATVTTTCGSFVSAATVSPTGVVAAQ